MLKLIVVFFCILLFSCNGRGSNSSASKSSPKADTTTIFKKEIPTYKIGGVDLFYELKRKKEKQLKLDSLESGFDSLQIRIWYDDALSINRKLIIIKRANQKWTADHYEMIVEWDAYKNTETITTNKVKSLLPKSGWHNFITKLLDLKIMTLPNMNDIPGLVDKWHNGITYNIEVATKKQYRFYGYHQPGKFEDKYWQAKKMTEIVTLVSTQLE